MTGLSITGDDSRSRRSFPVEYSDVMSKEEREHEQNMNKKTKVL